MNKIVIVKCLECNGYHICVDGISQAFRNTAQDVITWLEFNWPVGTKVRWTMVNEHKKMTYKTTIE